MFVGDIAPGVREELRASLDTSRQLFAAQFGVEASAFTVYAGPDLAALAPEYLAIRGRENAALCGDQDHDVIFQVIGCKDPTLVLAHEYVHVLQHQLAAGASLGPAWLTEGVAVYGEALHRAVVEQGLTPSEGLKSRRRQEAAALLRAGDVAPLRSFETVEDDAERIHYHVGFLAADWLADHAGVEALAGYYRRLPSSDSWQEAFEGAFGNRGRRLLRELRGLPQRDRRSRGGCLLTGQGDAGPLYRSESTKARIAAKYSLRPIQRMSLWPAPSIATNSRRSFSSWL